MLKKSKHRFFLFFDDVSVEKLVDSSGNPVTAQVVGMTGQIQLLKVLAVFHKFGNHLQ